MNNIFEQSDMHPTFIFVDGSYYCFYRFHALKNWWKNAHPDEPLTEPIENTTFVEKFKKTFVENLLAIPKKLKLHKTGNKPITVVAKDCKRKNIWRMNLFTEYKGSRKTDNQIGPFFEKVYSDDLFEKGGAKKGMIMSEVMAIVEEDGWKYEGFYHDGESMVCSSFVTAVWKAAGLFGDLKINAVEWLPKDVY